MKIYVASSWRNEALQQIVVKALRALGHEVYDFRNPEPGNNGFAWRSIDEGWDQWMPEQFADILEHPIAKAGFNLDMSALKACDACVLVLPCGRSAHLELGYAVGAGKKTYVLCPNAQGFEPELMYAMCDGFFTNLSELYAALPREPVAR